MKSLPFVFFQNWKTNEQEKYKSKYFSLVCDIWFMTIND